MNSFVSYLLMAAPAGAEGGAANPIMTFLPFILIIGIFYFLMIRPQQKKQKETQRMLSELKKGDRVVTIGGIHGVIQNVRETTVIVKVDDGVKLEINRGAVSSVRPAAQDDDDSKESKKESGKSENEISKDKS